MKFSICVMCAKCNNYGLKMLIRSIHIHAKLCRIYFSLVTSAEKTKRMEKQNIIIKGGYLMSINRRKSEVFI